MHVLEAGFEKRSGRALLLAHGFPELAYSWRHVMLPLATLRLSSNEKRERSMSVLEQVGLGGKASRLPNQLSGGEQGRLAIARAIVNAPPLLLADEPTGTLDTKTGSEIMEVFLSLNAQGQTIFMVTHNPENARLAHRTIQIRDGSVVSDVVQPQVSVSLAPATAGA